MKKMYSFWTLFITSIAVAQAPAILWQKSIGGESTDYLCSVIATDDGGCAVAGYSNSNTDSFAGNHGGLDILIAKFDNNGIVEWQKLYGGTGKDIAKDIKRTSDGGYIVVGASESNNGDATANQGYTDYWILKLSTIGDIQWQKSIGGSSYDTATRVVQTGDGGYLVAGESISTDGDRLPLPPGNPHKWVVKLNAAGTISWHTSFSSNIGTGTVELVQQTSGNFLIGCSHTQSFSVFVDGINTYYTNCLVKQFDANGNVQWTKSYGGSYQEDLGALATTTDGGYVVAGHSYSNDMQVSGHHGTVGMSGSPDVWIFKIDNLGNIGWQQTLGGTHVDGATSIQQTTDGGYIVCNNTASSDGDVSDNHSYGYNDFWVTRLDQTGNLIWEKCLGGSESDYGDAIAQSSDGGFFVAGRIHSNNGDITQNGGGWDGWVVKLGADTLSVKKNESSQIAIVPNPVYNRFTITGIDGGMVTIVDALGKIVKTQTNTGMPIDIEAFPPGLYLLKIQTSEGVKVTKILKY